MLHRANALMICLCLMTAFAAPRAVAWMPRGTTLGQAPPEKTIRPLRDHQVNRYRKHPTVSTAPTQPIQIKRITFRTVRVIAIDPGHGGENLGTRSIYGVQEKHVTLDVARKLLTALRNATNAEVFLTRQTDVPLGLSERIQLANRRKADLFISIHCNADPKQVARGIETYFLSANATDAWARHIAQRENGDDDLTRIETTDRNEVSGFIRQLQLLKAHHRSFALAKSVLSGLLRATGWHNRGVKQAPFGVLKGAQMPAIVVELGFLSHPIEARKLLDDAIQQKLVRGIVAGLHQFDRELR